ncbi:MAG TPA: YwiC-like family protein [Blastocatellia bacterium]|nr:YwiC-like family protein [Blastocatellia bacterium]
MSLRAQWKLPKEHGAWAMVSVSLALGMLVARQVSGRLILLIISVMALFIARESLVAWWRARQRGRSVPEAERLARFYLAVALVTGAPLVLWHHLLGLVPLGLLAGVLLLLNLRQAESLEDRTVLGEILAITGLTLAAPAAYYVARGRWESTALWLWVLSALYFTSSVFYVKLRVLSAGRRREEAQRSVWRQCLFYHSFLLAALVLLAVTGRVNLFVLCAFVPILARTLWALLRPVRWLNLTRIGILEIVYSLIFLVFLTLGFSPPAQ